MVGDNPHNVFASDGSWEPELVMDRGDRYERTFTEPGVVSSFRTFHGDAALWSWASESPPISSCSSHSSGVI